MRIAVIGGGNVGGTLARRWAEAGHEVTIGSRDPESPTAREASGSHGVGIPVASLTDAVAGAYVVLFAVPGAAMTDTIRAVAGALPGKIVIDASNNLTAGSPLNAQAEFAASAPNTQLFRAFNTLGWENFANPAFGGVAADLFYCGPSGPAQASVEALIRDTGLQPVYLGGPEQVAVVDGVARLWFSLVFGQKQPRHLAFKVLRDWIPERGAS